MPARFGTGFEPGDVMTHATWEPSKIVVGATVDGRTDTAVLRALELAGPSDGRVDVVHAVSPLVPRWLETVPERLIVAAEAAAQSGARCRARLAELPGWSAAEARSAAALHVTPGRPHRVVVEHAERVGADLLVLGTHRRRGVIDLGRTARPVLATAPCPVWVQVGDAVAIQRVVAPVDGSAASARVLSVARQFAERLGVDVDVVHAFEPPWFAYADDDDPVGERAVGPTYVVDDLRASARQRLDQIVAEHDWGAVTARAQLAIGDPVEQVLAHSVAERLVVLGTHGRSAFARALLGSVAQGVVRAASGPVCVVPTAAPD